jgi:hypothetical protein
MNRDFVPYEESLAFKELGFDEPCLAYYLLPEIERTGDVLLHYCSRGKEIIRNNDWSWVYENFPTFRKYLKAEHCYTYSTNSSRLMVSAPTFSQAFRWFRENHGLYANLSSWTHEEEIGIYHEFEIYGSPHSSSVTSTSDTFETYEDMELACLKKLIKITNEQQKTTK